MVVRKAGQLLFQVRGQPSREVWQRVVDQRCQRPPALARAAGQARHHLFDLLLAVDHKPNALLLRFAMVLDHDVAHLCWHAHIHATHALQGRVREQHVRGPSPQETVWPLPKQLQHVNLALG